MDVVFAIGEVVLLLFIIVFAVAARWMRNRETAREIAELPLYEPNLHGLGSVAARAPARDGGLEVEFASLHTARQHTEELAAKEHEEIVEV